MEKRQCIILLLCMQVVHSSAISIISTEPRPDKIITEGSNLTISCTSSMPWFFCLFHSPMGEISHFDSVKTIPSKEFSIFYQNNTKNSLKGPITNCGPLTSSKIWSSHGAFNLSFLFHNTLLQWKEGTLQKWNEKKKTTNLAEMQQFSDSKNIFKILDCLRSKKGKGQKKKLKQG